MESNYTAALIYATGWTVVHSLWQALTIALILSVILISTPRRLAHWRYSCAGIALLLVLLSGAGTGGGPGAAGGCWPARAGGGRNQLLQGTKITWGARPHKKTGALSPWEAAPAAEWR